VIVGTSPPSLILGGHLKLEIQLTKPLYLYIYSSIFIETINVNYTIMCVKLHVYTVNKICEITYTL
jgi:hypothetical protein